MTHTYPATGIILKGMPLGEYDRLVSVLTSEHGLIRAVAPGARKYRSKLRGRCELFVVNHMSIVKGRSLDKIVQADTSESYPGLSRDLGKLSASHYLAELVLSLALSDQPQKELYELLLEHLRRIEHLDEPSLLIAHIAQAVFHLLALTGFAPQVHRCCLTRQLISVNCTGIGFSFETGGVINLTKSSQLSSSHGESSAAGVATTQASSSEPEGNNLPIVKIDRQLRTVELILLQQLGNPSLPHLSEIFPQPVPEPSILLAWIRVERLLRDYAQYHIGCSLRSASLIEELSPLEF